MQVITGTQTIPPAVQGAFITIGNFDGVHRGHRHIFRTMLGEASREGRKALLVTFDPHPKMVLHPERRPFYLLTTLEEKLHLLETIGLDAVILIPFTIAYAQTSAESFIVDFLWNKLQAGKIFIGHDYTFGYKKGGNKEVLAAYGKKLGFEVSVITAFSADGSIISSTNIRKAILEGDVKRAALLLGRPYNASGTVVAGAGRGRTLGFPTANVRPTKELLPARGVYAAFITVEGETYQGVLNIGNNPTFGDNRLSLEVHIMDFTGNLYGKPLEALFIDRLREERTFPGPEELVVQMKKDLEQARSILRSSVR